MNSSTFKAATSSISKFGNKTARRVKFSEIAIDLLPERFIGQCFSNQKIAECFDQN